MGLRVLCLLCCVVGLLAGGVSLVCGQVPFVLVTCLFVLVLVVMMFGGWGGVFLVLVAFI